MFMKIKKYIGDKAFYKMIMGIALPIMIQNGISNFVSLLDNLMVGRLGTEAMSGVSVVNQFLFIFNLMIFGATSAAGIFMAQYHGYGDKEGEKHTFRFKFLICVIAGIIGTIVLGVFSEQFISLFLKGESIDGDAALTLETGKQYLFIMLFGLIPFAVSNVYSSSMRETNDAVTPMIASLIAVATNFIFNLLLIFGYMGFPALGAVGAAIATVISRFVELLILVIYTHVRHKKYEYIEGAFRSMYIPKKLCKEIIIRGMPLMINEFFWSIAITMSNQCYSTRALEVVAAQNIYTTILNLFNVVYLSMGNAIAIVVGNLLGAGKLDEARDTDRKMVAFSVFCGVIMGVFLAGISTVFPLLYNTSEHVRNLATYMILFSSILMPINAFVDASYFTMRSGGQMLITVLFDSVYMWVIKLPVCFCLAYFTSIDIYWLFAIGQTVESLRAILGGIFMSKGAWVRQLVKSESPAEQSE